ncbi:hypothetical protein RJT34_07347 [Clitoria ternatea]|uniref:Uncharacterized protein n=1 Tax=Clitoria ternatea TaxID=43366 RepID=A0AAN9K2J4_CLITE
MSYTEMKWSTAKTFDTYGFQEELSLVFVYDSNSSREAEIRVHNELSCPGTYLYHAQYVMQREAGLHGLIQVAPNDPELFAYDLD